MDPPKAALERHTQSRYLGRWIRVGDAAAKGAPAAYLRVGDQRHCLVNQRRSLGDDRIMLDLGLACHCAQTQSTIRVRADEKEFRNPVQIDQHRRLSQAKVHHRNQALPARQDLGVKAILGQVRQGLFY